MLRTVMLASLMGLGAANVCTPNFIGGQRMFVVEQEGGKNRRTVPAVEGTTDAATFYNYESASSHTGLEKVGTSVMFLYRNVNDPSGTLDLFWIHGNEVPTQDAAEADALISGLPAGVTIAQADDKKEFKFTDSFEKGVFSGPNVPGPRVAGNWWFKDNTDGGALSGFQLSMDWEIKIEVELRHHLHSWEFLFGEGHNPLVLDTSEATYLHPVEIAENEVLPYPQEAGAINTYCATANGGIGDLEYTFSWGDETADTVVTKASGVPACAEHTFCGVLSATCLGTYPRAVKVSVRSTAHGCINNPPSKEILALESDPCFDGVGVKVGGEPVIPSFDGVSPLGVHNVPSQFSGMTLFVPAGGLEEEAVMELKCCGEEECSFVVSTYHCPPCSQGKNGGFPGTLPSAGFAAGSCAPRFGEASNKMTSFYVTVPAGGSVPLPEAATAAPYVAVFGKRGALDAWCPTAQNKGGCGGHGPCPPVICSCDV